MPGPNENSILQQQEQVQQIQTIPQSVEEELEEKQRAKEEQRLRQAARQRRQSRTEAIQNSYRVQIPKLTLTKKGVSLEGELYARKHKETLSAKKRQTRKGLTLSALYQKNKNAKTIEDAVATWKNPELLEDFTNVERSSEALRQFMEWNLNFDLRTDKAFAAESIRLEEVSKKTAALQRLLELSPDILQQQSEDVRIDLEAKLDLASRISNYYEMRKKIITNTYYKNHYNSEISYQYHENDTLEQKNLTMLLWQAESLKGDEVLMKGNTYRQSLELYRETKISNEERQDIQRARNVLRPVKDPEYGKNNREIEDSRHAEYFRLHDNENDPIFRRLVATNYQVSGEREVMSESFFRTLACAPRWKAIQQAPPELVQTMIENLARTTTSREPEEIAACRAANLEGMRVFKELIKKHMNYLKRKYGNGFWLLSPEELMEHQAEYNHDFTNMQGLSAFLKYLKHFPGMYDANDASDLEMEQLLSYYDGCTFTEAMERKDFLNNGEMAYTDYKRKLAVRGVWDKLFSKSFIEISDTMHLDVRWNVAYEENARQQAE